MFPNMRRFKQELSQEDTIRILQENSYGVLALEGDDGYPYAVPLGYHYADGHIYFHGAKQGHKMTAIGTGCKASFCVVAQDKVVPSEFTTYFISAIAFGKVSIVEDESKKRAILEMIAEKYAPGDVGGREHEISKAWKAVCVFQLELEHMTGKAAMQVIREKKNQEK